VPPLAVDPEALSAAGSAVVAAGDGLNAALVVLTAGFGANTGLDAAGMVFGLAYQAAAESLLRAATAAINACRYNGAKIQLGASNYSKAEAASTLSGGASVLQPPGDPVKTAAPGPPGTLGPAEPPPLLWAVVQSFVSALWPDGDVAAIRAAAGCWRSFGAAPSGMQGALNAAKPLIGAQQIPEGQQISEVVSKIGAGMDRIGEQCGKMAATLDDFANEVAHAQSAIRDLLHRLGSVSGLWHDVVSVFDGDAIEEIKNIAKDIQAVLHNLGREARASEQAMRLGMQVADGLVVGMEKDVRGLFTHFLGDDVGNPVATVFDTWVNVNEGVFKDAFGMMQGLVDLDPQWLLLDPKGMVATWMGMSKTGLINHFLDPHGAAGADKQMFKSMLHLDDWRGDRPGLGAGENAFDVAMLLLPGAAEAGAGAEGAVVTARGAEAADAAGVVGRGGRAAGELGDLAGASGGLGDITRTSSGLTKDLDGLSGNLPKTDRPLGGRPLGVPTPKPLEARVEPMPRPVESAPPRTPLPESPTAPSGPVAPGRQGAPVRPYEPVPSPVDGPHPTGAPGPSETLPPTDPPISEPVPAPAAPSTPQLPSALHALDPHLTPPPDGWPTELSAPGSGGWHGSADGSPPAGRLTQERGSLAPVEAGPHGSSEGIADGPVDGGDPPTFIYGLTWDDLGALADYTGYGYEDLNGALRSDAVDASQHARVEALSNALEKLPAYQGPVIRGTNLPPEVLDQYQPGEVITEDAFLSATTNTAVARSPAFAGNVEFRILSNTGRDISPVSMFPGEQEILFPAGTRFYVVSKILDPLTGRTVIRMVER
jgi:hypothetical protein